MKDFFRTILYQPLYNFLIYLAWLVPGHSIGWAIIILTIIIRLILLPGSIKASEAQARMSLLQPEINKIRKEIKDQKAQSQAMMELYKREGVSPFGPCLPLLIQLPVIMVLYQVFRVGLDESRFSLLYSFVPHPEKINPNFLGINLSHPDLYLFPILAGVLQFVLSKLTMNKMPATSKEGEADPMQMATKQMIYIFPLVTVFIARSLPAALSLYWIITTVFGIFQQLYVNKKIKQNPKIKKEVMHDAEEIEEKYIKKEGNKKPDLITKMMNKKLERQEKKTGVDVVIRKKNK